MSTSSNLSTIGLTAYAENPVWAASARYQIQLNPLMEGYSHTIDANGGYKSASLGLKLRQDEIEDWLESGLGRHIVIYNEGGAIKWEGFVNDIEASIGGLTIRRGPLMSVANKVRIIYSTVDTSTTPPTMGVRKKLAYANDTASQTKYGIIEKTLSTGGSTEANAAYIRDTYIGENAEAETTPLSIAVGGGGDLTIKLNCLGYIHWLNAYPYNNATAGTTTISARIQAVLTADPNGIISTDYTKITANTMSIPAWENDDPLAWDYINGLVVMGDAAYNRYTFGLYANRRAYYSVVPSTQTYVWRIGDGGNVYTPAGMIVDPWEVVPAQWVQIPDFMIGRIGNLTSIRDDPRFMFIESLTYTAPYGLTLNGAKVNTLPQILGQLGLSGIGA